MNLMEKINLIADHVHKVGVSRGLMFLKKLFILSQVLFSSQESGAQICEEVLGIVSWLARKYIFNYIEEKISEMLGLLQIFQVIEMLGWGLQLFHIKFVCLSAWNEFSVFVWERCQTSIAQESIEFLLITSERSQTSKFF